MTLRLKHLKGANLQVRRVEFRINDESMAHTCRSMRHLGLDQVRLFCPNAYVASTVGGKETLLRNDYLFITGGVMKTATRRFPKLFLQSGVQLPQNRRDF